jgi:cytochrome P450
MEDLHLRGREIHRGDLVAVVIGAANHDPDHFDDPDRLDLARPDNRHLGYGFGIHFCLGATLARVEVHAALAALLRRFPSLTLATDAPEWNPSIGLRGLSSLPLAFAPQAVGAKK